MANVVKDETEKLRQDSMSRFPSLDVLRRRRRSGQQGDLVTVKEAGQSLHFFPANKKPTNIAELKKQGYDFAKPEEAEYVGALTVNGAQELGDLVLMCTPKDNHEDILAQQQEELGRRDAQNRQRTREDIEKMARDEGRFPAHKQFTFDDAETR